MAEKRVLFDMARYLDSEESIAEYLTQVLAPGFKPRFDTILRVTRALGVTFAATSTHANVVLEN